MDGKLFIAINKLFYDVPIYPIPLNLTIVGFDDKGVMTRAYDSFFFFKIFFDYSNMNFNIKTGANIVDIVTHPSILAWGDNDVFKVNRDEAIIGYDNGEKDNLVLYLNRSAPEFHNKRKRNRVFMNYGLHCLWAYQSKLNEHLENFLMNDSDKSKMPNTLVVSSLTNSDGIDSQTLEALVKLQPDFKADRYLGIAEFGDARLVLN